MIAAAALPVLLGNFMGACELPAECSAKGAPAEVEAGDAVELHPAKGG